MVDLISPALMANLRALDESAMPSTCRVLREVPTTVDGRTSYPEEPTQVGADLPCRLGSRGLRPVEGQSVGRLADETHGEVALPLGTDIHSGDTIEVTTGISVETFEVVGDPWPGSYSTNLTVTVTREG